MGGIVCALALVGLLAPAQVPERAGPVLVGRVVDERGEPLAGARVGLGTQAELAIAGADNELLDVVRTGADGGFRLVLSAEWLARVNHRAPVLIAQAPGRALVVEGLDVETLPIGHPLELSLAPAAPERVRVVDAQGAPVAGAHLLVLSFDDGRERNLRLPPGWWMEGAPSTDVSGWAELPIALRAVQRLRIVAPQHPVHDFQVDWESRTPLSTTLTLQPRESLWVSWEGESPPAPRMRIRGFPPPVSAAAPRVEVLLEVTLPPAGPLELLGAPGRPVPFLWSEDPADLTWTVARDPSSERRLHFTRGESYRVEGRVVCARTGIPVSGARILFSADPVRAWVESGQEGRFSFDTAARGGNALHVQAPQGFRSATRIPLGFARPSEGALVELPDVRLQPTQAVRGRVLDLHGAPAAGAWIFARGERREGMFVHHEDLTALADEAGRFELRDAPVDLALALAARLPGFLARARVQAGEDVELQLAPLFAARGRLVDPDRRPIAGVRIELWRAPPPRHQFGQLEVLGGREFVRSAADGSFETPRGLEPGVSYALRVEGAGIETHMGPWTPAEELAAGAELELRRRASLAGTLRAADGSPLTDLPLRVRRGRAATRTDGEGRFELDDLPPGGDLLIVELPGEPPAVRWVRPEPGLGWTLPGADAPRPPVPEPAFDRGLELRLAEELLEGLFQEALAAGDEGRLLRATQALALADPALAFERIEAEMFRTAWMRDFALAAVADSLRASSPEEALAVGRRIAPGMGRSLSVLQSARELGGSAEHEHLALVRAEARAIEPPAYRLVTLTDLAERLLELGERAVALEVFDQARELAGSLPAVDWPGYARARLGEVLLAVDPPAGRALIDTLEPADDRGRHLGNGAQRLAPIDPRAAEELLDEVGRMRGSWTADRFASRVAHAMAPVDLPRALALAERHDPSGISHGMIALALAEAPGELDRAARIAAARAALETAYRAVEDPGRRPGWGHGAPTVAAALLPVVERVDPRRLAEFVARALAVPRPPERSDAGGERTAWIADATLAFYLARWDRELARELCGPAVEALRGDERPGTGYREALPFAAACVIDPEWAASLARELGGQVAEIVGRVLAQPPEQRSAFVQERYLHLWIVGKEDL